MIRDGAARNRRVIPLADIAPHRHIAPQQKPPQPASPPGQTTVIRVNHAVVEECGGAELIERTTAAIVRPGPAVEDRAKAVIEQLRSIKPQGAIEGGLSGLFVAMERAAFDCMRLARLAGLDTPMGITMIARAEKLAIRCIEAADALSRQRYRGQQHVTVEHIHVHEGGRAVVGVVNAGREARPNDG
jgi:hypothetical protein